MEGGTRVDTGLLGGVTVAVVEAGVEGAGDGEAAADWKISYIQIKD